MFLLDKCGEIDIDHIIPGTTSTLVTIIKILVPIVLIIFGILDLFKAVIANDDKEMKEAQKKLLKRVVYAIVVFLVVSLVTFVFNQLAKADTNDGKVNSSTQCINCFINGTHCNGS